MRFRLTPEVVGVMDGMMGMGWWMFLWGAVGVAVLLLIVLASVRLARSLRSDQRALGAGEDAAEAELRRRYAAGDLDRDTYLQRLNDLRNR